MAFDQFQDLATKTQKQKEASPMAVDTPEDYKPLPKKDSSMDFSQDKSAAEADYTRQLSQSSKAVGMSSQYDTLFEKYRDDIPLAYLKALAFKASGMNANKGLFGVSLAAVKSIKPDATATDLADPVINTRAAIKVIKNVVDYFAANYPASMTRNWTSSDYISLVTHAYNVGYKATGLGKPMASLYKTNKGSLSFENVVSAAKVMKQPESTYSPKFTAFAKDVANLTITQPIRSLPGSAPSSDAIPLSVATKKKGFGGLAIAALVGIPMLGIAVMSKRGK